jgi:hypothetical protein
VLALALPLSLAAEPAAPEHAQFVRSATCVAALKARAEPLAQRVRHGDAAAEVPLTPIVQASFAFIATSYKQGLRQPKADEMLQRAEQAQAKLPAEALTKLQDTCQAEGDHLLAEATAFERMLVGVAVRKRIAKLRNVKPPDGR